MNQNDILKFIIKEAKQIIIEEQATEIDVDENTNIFGENALLDSLGLVTLIVKVEEFVLKSTGVALQIVDEEVAFGDGDNPLRTPASLASLVVNKLNAK